MIISNVIWLFTINILFVSVRPREIYSLEEKWVCLVKKTCHECLKMPPCSWCSTENKCFSEAISSYEGYCSNDTIKLIDYGFSISTNAECACAKGEVEKHCHPPGSSADDAPACMGRGDCVCGRCICNAPDKDDTAKLITGRFCELDNFSCNGSHCNEGPYSLLSADVEEGPLE